jgi:prevent-host-death family protein
LVRILTKQEIRNMKVMPLSEVKAKLSALVDEVASRDEAIVITRNGRAQAVLVSHDQFEGWRETVEILTDKELMKEIRRGLRVPRAKLRRYTVADLFGD